MSQAIYYPPADRTSAWWGKNFPGVEMQRIDKLLLHSIEGGSWSPFANGSETPTLSYHPGLRKWRQHLWLNHSARALKDPTNTPVRENRDNVVQVEIVGTCDPRLHASNPAWPYIPELSADNLKDIAELFAFLHKEWGTPLNDAPSWLPFPISYGPTRVRMSSPTYDNFKGLCGHMHAPGNVHGDPGAIDHATIVLLAREIVNEADHPTTPIPPVVPVQPLHTHGSSSAPVVSNLQVTQTHDGIRVAWAHVEGAIGYSGSFDGDHWTDLGMHNAFGGAAAYAGAPKFKPGQLVRVMVRARADKGVMGPIADIVVRAT